MRLLCLHGYASNGETFVSVKSKLLREALSSVASFIGLDGSACLDSGKHGKQRAWFTFDPPYPLSDRSQQPVWRAHEFVVYCGAEAAVDALVEEWRRCEYDGVIGFSQGALMAAMLVARLELIGERKPAVAILCNGFRTPLPSNPELDWWRDMAPRTLATRALCICGTADPVDTGGQSELLAALFRDARVHVIEGGSHAMPKEKVDLQAVLDFCSAAGDQPSEVEPLLSSARCESLRIDLRVRPSRDASGVDVRCGVSTVIPRMPAECASCESRAAHCLHSSGVVRLDKLFSAKLAAQLRAYCESLLDDRLLDVSSGTVSPTDILAPHLLVGTQHNYRHDLMLSLTPIVREALSAALPLLEHTLSSLLGKDAELFELSTVISSDGTPPQPMHVDFPRGSNPPTAIVAFVALHDLTPKSGPTNFAVGTHSDAFAAAVAEAWDPHTGSATRRSDLMKKQAVCAPLLKAGDAVLMDSSLFHGGGANASGKRRTLFHFTFARRGTKPGKRKASLLPELSERYALSDFLQ